MPLSRVQLATRENIQCGTSRNCYVSDGKTSVMSRESVVYSVWEDVEAVVKEKDEEEYDERKKAELNGGADLSRHYYSYRVSDRSAYNPACHLWPSWPSLRELGG